MICRLFLLLALVVLGCAPGQIFGPPMDDVSIKVSSRLPGDTLEIYINGELYGPLLTDYLPSHLYRVRIQTRNDRYYDYYYDDYDYGEAYVEAWSYQLGRLSRTQSKMAYTDRVTSFEFRLSDFR